MKCPVIALLAAALILSGCSSDSGPAKPPGAAGERGTLVPPAPLPKAPVPLQSPPVTPIRPLSETAVPLGQPSGRPDRFRNRRFDRRQ